MSAGRPGQHDAGVAMALPWPCHGPWRAAVTASLRYAANQAGRTRLARRTGHGGMVRSTTAWRAVRRVSDRRPPSLPPADASSCHQYFCITPFCTLTRSPIWNAGWLFWTKVRVVPSSRRKVTR